MREEMLVIAQGEEIEIVQFYKALSQDTREHNIRVADVTVMLLRMAMEEGLCEEEPLPLPLEKIWQAVLFHDIGKVLIPERILEKTDELTCAERKVLQKHSSYGGKMLDKYRKEHQSLKSEEKFWGLAAETALSHHERWDGKGYPFGLLATAIPIVSRTAAIAECYDSLVYGAKYRMPLPHEFAFLEIVDNSGKQFDPNLVNIFKKHAAEFKRLAEEEADT